MGMMGSGSGSGEFGNFYDLIGLLNDDGRYKAKVDELDSRIRSVQATYEKASEINKKTEDSKHLATEMLNNAHQKLVEAGVLKAAQDKLAQQTADKEAALVVQRDNHAKEVAFFENEKANSAEEIAGAKNELKVRETAVLQAEADAAVLKQKTAEQIDRIKKDAEVKAASVLQQAQVSLVQAESHKAEAAKIIEDLANKKQEFEAFLNKMKS